MAFFTDFRVNFKFSRCVVFLKQKIIRLPWNFSKLFLDNTSVFLPIFLKIGSFFFKLWHVKKKRFSLKKNSSKLTLECFGKKLITPQKKIFILKNGQNHAYYMYDQFLKILGKLDQYLFQKDHAPFSFCSKIVNWDI